MFTDAVLKALLDVASAAVLILVSAVTAWITVSYSTHARSVRQRQPRQPGKQPQQETNS